MTPPQARSLWLLVLVTLVVSAGLMGVGSSSAVADVTAVAGSAYGFSSNVSLFGGPSTTRGPAPTVTLPAGGSATPVSSSAAAEQAVYGPAHIFDAGPTTVTTQGTPGPTGSVTSTATIQGCAAAIANSCSAGQVYGGPFTATSVTATCTANQTGTAGSVSIVNGSVVTSTDSSGNPLTTIAVPGSPPANSTISGTINSTGGGFTWVFNEQTTNQDGSLTINAAHEILGATGTGPAKGDLIIGQVVCGATVVATTTTTTAVSTTTTTTVPGVTTTTTASTTTTTASTTTAVAATTTTVAPTTTTSLVVQVGGSAYGFYSNLGLFGGPPAARGPTPTVTLPDGGSATPVTASAPSGNASYGPAQIFSSGPITLSTQGTPTGGSVTSATRIESIQPAPFSADLVTSTCTANQAGVSAAASFTNAKMVTSTDANGDPATTTAVPANPPPNYTLFGTINNVGGSFKYVFNEQVVNGNGSITVNAGHEYIGGGPNNTGPALGDLIFGQAVCAWAASATASAGGQTPNGAAGGSSSLSTTGADVARLFQLAVALLAAGCVAVGGVARRRRELGAPSE